MSLQLPRSIKIIHIALLNGLNWFVEKGIAAESEDILFASWYATIARRMGRQFPSLDIELWDSIPGYLEKRTATRDGVQATLFSNPRRSLVPHITRAMARRLDKVSRERTTFVHVHAVHNSATYYLAWRFPAVKVVAQSHGDFPPLGPGLKPLAKRIVERLCFPRLHAATYCVDGERHYLRGIMPERNIHFLPVGADYDMMVPMEKTECRRRLGLDPDATYALYVGKFYRLKGVDAILDSYYALKSKYNFKVIFVGGEENADNDLYREVAESGCPFFKTRPWSEMRHYYGASDFLVHSGFRYYGFDVACLEALAANRPVATSYFNFIPFDHSAWGMAIPRESAIGAIMEAMIQRHREFTDCRDSSMGYFSKEAIITRTVREIYGLSEAN